MKDVARQVCMTAGRGRVGKNDGVGQISKIPREHIAPDAAGAAPQDLLRFANFKRTDQTFGCLLDGIWAA